ncbi:MAG: hypothetical protein KKA28_19495 [Planctomycetes bacterium]|nr:hypothetical protein [Planctomycetota bacterium]MBU4432750.1 hypothetical protein [Patescibacteria group bacterium]
MSRSRAPQGLPKKGFALFEAQPSLQSPGSIEEHRESRQRRDKWQGAFSFWFFFFGQAKKKNRRMERIPLAAEVAWQAGKSVRPNFPAYRLKPAII